MLTRSRSPCTDAVLFDKEMERQVEQIFKAMLNKHTLDLQLDRSADKTKALLKSSELFASITKGICHDLSERMEKFMRFRSGA
jgi:hypothetical protein